MPFQSSPTNYPQIYTHAPEPNPNLLIGGLQLLFWLFFHPVAWHKHVQRIRHKIDSLADLKKPSVYQPMLQGYLIVPLWANLILGLVISGLGQPLPNVFSIVTSSLGCCVALSVAFGVADGVAVGVALALEEGE
ncbi:MAG: hypothetical protein ICV78_22655 [Tolypothrix sp. Co-bin9]|nr:hypothetical protein [Tolypothrix sp. Co-bin9]